MTVGRYDRPRQMYDSDELARVQEMMDADFVETVKIAKRIAKRFN